MTDEQTTQHHSKDELSELNELIVAELEKLNFKKISEETHTANEDYDGAYHVTRLESSLENIYELYSLTDRYETVLARRYSIATQIGRNLTEETTEELLNDLPDDFPVDVEDRRAEAAGLVALSNMSDKEKKELNYRIADEINTQRLLYDGLMHENVVHSVRIMGSLFPEEGSHNIHRTEEIVTGIKSATTNARNFIRYTFSGLGGKDSDDIVTEGPIF